MANSKLDMNGPVSLSDTQPIPYDEVVETYLPAIKENPAVSTRDTTRHFSPHAIRYFAREGVLPYLLDSVHGEITFALDNKIYNFMNAQDFRTRFGEMLGFLPHELKRLMSDDKLKFVYLPSEVIERLAPFVANPELIETYENQRKSEAAVTLGDISNKEAIAYLDGLINRAITERASDIHLEVYGGLEHRVRLRVDGKLREVPNALKADSYQAVVSILKNRCGAGVNIAEKRRPQDGKITFMSSNSDAQGSLEVYDLRAAFRPVVSEERISLDKKNSNTHVSKENVILRIAQRGTFKTLDQLGLSGYDHERIKQVCAEPTGLVLVTGPTGSGKTTTLYGMLHSINDSTRKIVTIEDPVEVHIKGLQQTQVHKDIGVDFPSFLRSALRADPDVIFVGEIRDKETADTAIEAAMTGHLVMSSLHTNNAPGAVNRLMNMDISKIDLAMNLRGVLAQTLVPVFEEKLQERILASQLTSEDLIKIRYILGDEALNKLTGENIYPAGSMPFCEGDDTAFSGRQALTEFWLIDEKSQDAICNPNAGVSLLTSVAEQSGMRPMFISGVEKVRAGVTSLEAVVDAVGQSVFRRKKELLREYIRP